MHIPDGMLEARTWIPAWLGSAGILAYGARRVRVMLSDGTIVMMAVMAALIFALQMLNFPVAGGTSGHFAGGAAAAIVLGIWPAMLVMAAVVTIQALLFADGGITALGANLLTMAIVGPLVGRAAYVTLRRFSRSRGMQLGASFAAAWSACVGAALVAALMLWLSGRAPLGAVAGAMGFWHALIGIGEGAITAGLVGYLLAVRPDLLTDAQGRPDAVVTRKVVIGLGAIALVAAGVSFVASSNPDGLEYAYERVGAAFDAATVLEGPMPDYVIPGIANETLAGVLAAIVGVVVTGVLALAALTGLRGRKAEDGQK
ncbi:MAG: energy-coupling factor ABC transporter permease [Coriobacteriia bacterium]